ncbi:MAG: helix-turn-helix domain-containing protein [Neisseriaceae bacterium]|nr:helix-turn-helix domain-containing protein [Neisseriaceae bacterium]
MNLETWIAKESLSQSEFADLIGITGQAVSCWFLDFAEIAPKNIWKIYEITNGEVMPHELRPDLYPVKLMKQIYGCVRCREQSPNDYKKWFHALEAYAVQNTKYATAVSKKYRLERMKEQLESE